MGALLIVLGIAAPVAIYLWREHKLNTPSLQWPVLGRILNLQYQAEPAPKLTGQWNGRQVAVEMGPAGVQISVLLNAATRLRVECALKDVVVRRAGIVVPDPVEPIVPEFRDRPLLARCSDKAAGPVIFDAAMQQTLAQLPDVDFVGQKDRVAWTVPVVRDPDGLELVLGTAAGVADALEHYPAGGPKLA